MGSEAWSEVENRNLRHFLTPRNNSVKFFNSLHSYGQMVLLPWGWTTAKPDNYDDIYSLAMAATEALTAVHGTK